MILLAHPTGNENVRHAAESLRAAALLFEIWTCVAHKLSKNELFAGRRYKKPMRRHLSEKLFDVVRLNPLRECVRLLCGKFGRSFMGSEIIRLADIEAVYSEFDGIVEKRISATGKLVSVFAYEDGALRAFKAATICGARRLYEMPMGYWRGWHEIMLEEKDREPEWANTLQGLCDSQEKLEKKDEELALADQVIVASEFSKSTLIKAPSVKAIVETIPYGAPKVIGCVKSGFSNSVLKVIYVGALTQRKGISYLLRAVEIMGKGVRLSILGAKQAGKCLPLEKAMAKHLWIGSASHEMVLREIRKNDVLVLPSLFEGFGLVILEALSQGVPVIATTNTGGPDIIDDGSSGYIIPIRSAMELAGKLEMLRCDKSLRQYMSENAIVAAKRYSWERYMKSFYASIVGGDLAEQSHCSGSFNS